jgi:hypothetical protein
MLKKNNNMIIMRFSNWRNSDSSHATKPPTEKVTTMKKIALFMSLIISISAFAAPRSIEERIRHAAEILGTSADTVQEYSVTPNADAKQMMNELANQQGEEDFESNWVTDSSDMWEVDTSSWGQETRDGAYRYIAGFLENNLEESEKTPEDKVQFADGILQLNKAFNILDSIRSVKYGVAPLGAVQCGTRFPALLIIDTENGKIHQITMEGSGC